MKKIVLTLSLIIALFGAVRADEGMWTLPQISVMNIADMQAKGLKLSAEDIYSINKSSLKDAVVIFGGGCSGEIISEQGLVLTNHHCGYGAIQQHSTVENDYLKDGFWAMSLDEEIPTPGLTVTFVKEIIDVTEMILPKVKRAKSEEERQEKIEKVIAKIIKKYNKKANKKYVGVEAIIESFYGGNQYLLFLNQEYKDVRMVGAPPSSIGKFGGDTDNWMWPRHTGDFSLFRIYADVDGNPVEYSADNRPLKPAKSLTISLAGLKENDFAMIMGFPGSTERYMTSWEIGQLTEISNKNRIFIRGIRQDILMEDMLKDPKVKIQYASKYSSSSNYWKNSIGMNEALAKLNVKADKEAIEKEFTQWVNANPARVQEYGKALGYIKESTKVMSSKANVIQYINESIFRACELLSFATVTEKMVEAESDEKIEKFYKNFNLETEKRVAKEMFRIFAENIDKTSQPELFVELTNKYADYAELVEAVYNSDIYKSQESFLAYKAKGDEEAYKNDITYKVGEAFSDLRKALVEDEEYAKAKYDLSAGQRLLIKGLMEMNKGKKVYASDANFTLRLTYGSVKPYSPRDGVVYDYYTTLDGVIEKENLSNPEEFTVPAKVKELHKAKDYGRYANDKGELVVGFIADLDITGGNSGSPVLNSKGELIGTAFDGNWEAMSGDIAFEHNMQRCINVDIRYTLFIIDKFAGCTRLIDEMNIVE